MAKIRQPIYLKTFKNFKLKPAETIVFCEFWQSMETYNSDKIPFYYKVEKAVDELNISKQAFQNIIEKFKTLLILKVTNGRHNKNLFELDLVELSNPETLSMIVKDRAIQDFQEHFKELRNRKPPIVAARDNHSVYYTEIELNKQRKYGKEYKEFAMYINGQNPMGEVLKKAFVLAPIKYREFENHCIKLDLSGLEIKDVYTQLFDKEANYSNSKSMEVLLKKWVDQEVKFNKNQKGGLGKITIGKAVEEWKF